MMVISDANVIIDIVDGELVEHIFALPYTFMTPDILFFDELADNHPNLLDKGLRLVSLPEELITKILNLISKHAKPSRIDLSALVVAQHYKCPLLTGDKALRKVAEEYNIFVHGTIWLIDQLLSNKLITVDVAEKSLEKMGSMKNRVGN